MNCIFEDSVTFAISRGPRQRVETIQLSDLQPVRSPQPDRPVCHLCVSPWPVQVVSNLTAAWFGAECVPS